MTLALTLFAGVTALAIGLGLLALALMCSGRAIAHTTRPARVTSRPAVRPSVNRCPRCGGPLAITPTSTGRIIGRAACDQCELRLGLVAF